MSSNESDAKNPEADLRLKYYKVLEASLAIALLIMIGVFYSFKTFESSVQLPERPNIVIETIEIPQTQQVQKPPPRQDHRYRLKLMMMNCWMM